MLKLHYDLHIHSCLSPCGDDDMTPANIVHMAILKELDVIAVTDHNSCKNCPAVFDIAKKEGLLVIPGMELCTSEEVHVLCFFYTLEEAMKFDEYVSKKLIEINNDKKIFGKQEVYNKEDHKISEEPFLLINATIISYSELDNLMNRFNGIYIPAHIDKSSNSLLYNLGMIPSDSIFGSVEVMEKSREIELKNRNPYLEECNFIYNSDAHRLGEINEPIHFITVKECSIQSVIHALK